MTVIAYVTYGGAERYEHVNRIESGNQIQLLRHGIVLSEWVPSQVVKLEVIPHE